MKKEIIITKYLVDNGFRITKVRKNIIAYFIASISPISAIDIIEKLKNEGNPVNKTTVYRELDFLLKEELIKEVFIDGNTKLYELSSLDHHHHLVCINCKKVEDLLPTQEFLKQEQNFEQRIIKEKDVNIVYHSLEYFSLCAKCK